jgi:hypothetical protein
MKVDVYDQLDFPLLAEWYEAHGKPVPMPQMIPAMALKVIDDDGPVLFMAVVRDPSIPAAQLDFFLGKPGVSPWSLKAAAVCLLDFLKGYLPELGVKYVVAQIQDKRLSRIVQRHGFICTSSNIDLVATTL